MLNDEKRTTQFKYELGRLMGEYAALLPLGNFDLKNKKEGVQRSGRIKEECGLTMYNTWNNVKRRIKHGAIFGGQ